MKISKHAARRSQQRGFTPDSIKIILEFGTPERKPGNAIEYRLRKKDKEKLVTKWRIQSMDKITKKAVLVSDDDENIITVYNINERKY